MVRAVLPLVVLLASALCRAEDRPACWLVLGDTGRVTALAGDGARALRDGGFDVASAALGRAPKVIIVYPRALRGSSETEVVNQLVEEGAGLVVIYSMASDLRLPTDRLLSPWNVRLRAASLVSAETTLEDHPITAGIEGLFVWRVGAMLLGADPLIRQGNNVIAGVSTRGGTRLVVLPLDAVVPGQQNDGIPPPSLRLLVQAAHWAARTEPPSGAVLPASSAPVLDPPTLPSEPPPGRGEYRRLALLDLDAEDEDWPAIRRAVEAILKAAGLDPGDVRVRTRRDREAEPEQAPEPRSLPLVRALKDNPALVVLGSCRAFHDAEVVALGTYVRSGGALLVLPRATHLSNIRLVNVNAVLTEFGMAASLGRGDGQPEFASSTLTQDLGKVGKLTTGVLLVGHRGVALATCAGYPLVRADETGLGRIAVADPLPLLSTHVDADTTAAWGNLLGRLVVWLTQGMQIKAD